MDRNKRIATVFTVLYFVSVAVVARFFDRGREAGILTLFSVVVAAAAAAILWTVYPLLARRRRIMAWHLALFASVLPIMLFACSALALKVVASWSKTAVATQRSKIVVSDVRDEPLLSKRGNPLGVRLVYSVTFPNGRDLSLFDGPTAAAVFVATSSWEARSLDPRVSTTRINQHVSPELAGPHHDRYRNGTTYTFTEERVPGFLRSLYGPANVANRYEAALCLDSRYFEHKLAVDADHSRRLVVYVNNTSAGEMTTGREYPLAVFYQGAVREGIARCPDDLVPGLPYFR